LTALAKVLEENNLQAEEIERVTLYGTSAAKAFSAQETLDVMSSQFNFPHPAAMLAFRVPPGPQWFSQSSLHDPRVVGFKQRVFCEIHPETPNIGKWVEAGQWRKMPGRAEVVARGKTYVGETEYAKGDPWSEETYFTDEDLKRKFRDMALPLALSSEAWQQKIERIIEMAYDLERVKEVNLFTQLLSP